MSWPRLQAIDCDIHPSVPSMRALLPYLDDHWRETVEARGIASLESISYPRHAPLTARPDWRDESGQAATDLAAVRTQLLDHFGVRLAICNCLYGVQLVFDAYMARAFARAVNDWIAKEWLDPEPRLRASIVVPLQDPEFAVEEIERCARRPSLRPGAGARHGRAAARPAGVLADLCRRRAPRPADRHPCREQLSASGHLGRLADHLRRGLREPGPGLPGAAHEPDHRGRLPAVPGASRWCSWNRA